MGFLDFIFDNLFIVVIILLGIINFFNSIRKKEAERNRKSVDRKQHTPQQSQSRQSMENKERRGQPLGRMAERVERRIEDFTNQFDAAESTKEMIEEKQQAQYE